LATNWSDPFFGHNVFLGRYFNVVSKKLSNKKYVHRNILVKSMLQMPTSALLRRWLRVQVVVNPLFSLSACFPLGKAACRAVKAGCVKARPTGRPKRGQAGPSGQKDQQKQQQRATR
jgi:hypothetical protein